MKTLCRVALVSCVCLAAALVLLPNRSPAETSEPFVPLSVTRCDHLWSEVGRLQAEMIASGTTGRRASVFPAQSDRADSLASEIQIAADRYACECISESLAFPAGH